MNQQTDGIQKILQRRRLFLLMGIASAICAVIASIDTIANVTLVAIFGILSVIFLSVFSYFSCRLLKTDFATILSRFQRIVRWVAGLLLLSIVMLVAVYGLPDYARFSQLQYKGIETKALIADRYETAYSPKLKYTFEVNGKLYEKTIIDQGHQGITLPVKYLPGNPEVNLPGDKSVASALAMETGKVMLYFLLLLRAAMLLVQARLGKVNGIAK